MQKLIFEQGSSKKKTGVGFLDIPNRFSLLRKSRENKAMKIKIRRTGLNGLEGKKTEPNRTEYGRFEPVFGSVRFQNLKKKISI